MEQLVSIIIPAYNTQAYIAEMLDCVVSQTYTNLEIIVIDDGSTDNTADIVENYALKDSRIRLIRIPNSGVSNARNIGIENSNGSKIFFWDSDDIIEPDTVESCLNFAGQKNVNAVLYGYANYTDGVKGVPHKSILNEKYTGKEIINNVMPLFLGRSYSDVENWIRGKCGIRENQEHTALWRIMLDAKTIRNNNLRFDKKLSLGEDTKFINLYFCFENSIGYLDKCFYYLRQRRNSANTMSNADPKLMTKNKLKLISARNEIDEVVYKKYGINSRRFWKGTVVLSAVQLAMRLSNDPNGSFDENFSIYDRYMNNWCVRSFVNEFKPGLHLKSIPFIFIKGKRYKWLFVLCSMLPKKIANRVI